MATTGECVAVLRMLWADRSQSCINIIQMKERIHDIRFHYKVEYCLFWLVRNGKSQQYAH
jgi:hypothetical protein